MWLGVMAGHPTTSIGTCAIGMARVNGQIAGDDNNNNNNNNNNNMRNQLCYAQGLGNRT